MNRKTKWIIFLSAFCLVLNGSWHLLLADDDDHKKKSWYHNVLDWDDNDDDDDDHKHRKKTVRDITTMSMMEVI